MGYLPIILGALGSGFVTSLLTTYLNNRSQQNLQREERKALVEKEHYYKLLERADLIFGYMYQYEEMLDLMSTQLANNMVDILEVNKKSLDLKAYKQRVYELMHVYFPELIQDYNNYAQGLIEIADIYFEYARVRKMMKNLEEIKEIDISFRRNQYEFVKKLLALLETKRKKVTE